MGLNVANSNIRDTKTVWLKGLRLVAGSRSEDSTNCDNMDGFRARIWLVLLPKPKYLLIRLRERLNVE